MSLSLADLVARAEIADLNYRYALCLDRCDLDGVMALWTENAVFDETALGMHLSVGREQISQLFVEDFRKREASAHLFSNLLIDIAPGGDRATGQCSALVQETQVSGGRLRATALFSDAYVKLDGAWRFASRTVTALDTIDFTNDEDDAGDAK